MSETQFSGLITPEALVQRLGDSNLVVVDIRSSVDGGGKAAYEAGHVPGAVHSDYAADGWRAKVGNAPGMLPSLEHLAALAGRLGIKPHDDVVIVPAGVSATDFAAAARIYWTLKLIGHGQQAILDGGFKAWSADPQRPVEIGPSAPKSTDPYPVVMQQQLRSNTDATLVASRGKLATLVDARATSYFEGREKAAEATRAGHIPGAVSRDYAAAFDPETGALKPIHDLSALFAGVPNGPAISYCNTGHTAALNWFVMSEVLGREEVALYDGSMTDWTQDSERPVATVAAA
ncbi:sulfurtransferase [Bosea psychrotolerans]|uniref:Thiosulfate/3-mercaptopyruvate sulfurtransferase n=1 Tax=Bosea psychrotolerans TaxID=1871628 RepID=A0A2S4MLR4_9HYPH|nr:sulfurtransferase [Bosea psychrotolerans]POR55317.1 thiosulfate/3-mercaptopyruvate sulfurtransferase [Bosea psychrotolerans]